MGAALAGARLVTLTGPGGIGKTRLSFATWRALRVKALWWAGPSRWLGRWPPGDADLLAAWLMGLRAVCVAESYPQDEDSVRLLAIALITVLGEDGRPRTGGLGGPVHAALHDLCDRYGKSFWEPVHAADRYYDLDAGMPLAGLVSCLQRSSGSPIPAALSRRCSAASRAPSPADRSGKASADRRTVAAMFPSMRSAASESVR